MIFIIVLVCIILFCLIINISFIVKKCIKEDDYIKDDLLKDDLLLINKDTIPLVIYQTYTSAKKVPQKVKQQFLKFAPEYEYIFYDDKKCISFLKKYFKQPVIEKFQKLSVGAHKADLWRYCILYINGGIYMDIKTKLLKPLRDIFTNNYFYSVLSIGPNTIYQGIIATPPRNHLLLNAITQIINTPLYKFKKDYHIITKQLYNILKKSINAKPQPRLNHNNIYLFQEICTKGKDQYGFYCKINDKNTIFITRFNDFPWK